MIDSTFPFELNGVKYHAAEDAEGNHYTYSEEPLRAPNTQIVQGENSQKFNIRPDLLLWTWTDWSGGEGQLSWNAESPNKARILNGLRWWQTPGTIRAGYRANYAVDYLGAIFTERVGLAMVDGEMYAVGIGAAKDDVWERNSSTGGPAGEYNSFQDSVSMSTTDGAINERSMIGDQTYIFFIKHGTDDLYRWPVGGGAATLFNDQMTGTGAAHIEKAGDYFYIYFPASAKVYEVSRFTANTTTAEVAVLDLGSALILTGDQAISEPNRLVVGDGKVYLMWSKFGEDTLIYHVTPSSAAGTGYGSELSNIPGVRGEEFWWHAGLLFISGTDAVPKNAFGTGTTRRIVFYLSPQAAFGSIGELRSWSDTVGAARTPAVAGSKQGRVDSHALVLGSTLVVGSSDYNQIALFEIDATSGEMGAVGIVPQNYSVSGLTSPTTSLFFHKNYYMVGAFNKAAGNTYRVVIWDTDRYPSDTTPGHVMYTASPSFDFGIAALKVLHSIEVVTDPLPAGCSVKIGYSLDGATAVNATTITTTSSTGEKVLISTDSSTKTFKQMTVSVSLIANTTTSPVIRAVNVRASVVQHVKVWNLLLDCTDETAPRGHTGSTLMDNLIAIADNTVVDYKDGYQDREAGVYDTFDVTVDQLAIQADRPGAGFASITLREVV